jgi:hypothetical protein
MWMGSIDSYMLGSATGLGSATELGDLRAATEMSGVDSVMPLD